MKKKKQSIKPRLSSESSKVDDPQEEILAQDL